MNRPKMPPEKNGFIPTLNKTGYMTSSLGPYSKAFVESTSLFTEKQKAIEIGAAYGVATLEVLGLGKNILANDLDLQHLDILKSRAQELGMDTSRLWLAPGDFLVSLADKTLAGQFSSLLCSRVLHFLTPTEIEKSFGLMAELLKVGGNLYVVNETCYLKNFQHFIPTYEKRFGQGEVFAGHVPDVAAIDPSRGKNLPDSMTFFDVRTLRHLADKNGLEVIECGTFARPEFPEDLRLDGRESVGLIAKKIP